MLFNTYAFIFLFFPIAFIGMFGIGAYNKRLAALWLALASLVFYGVWDARYVLLLLTSICINYGAGCWMAGLGAGTRAAKRVLIGTITVDLLLLGYFKYADFFLSSSNQLFATEFPALNIILPLGISFFTFTQLAFLVDVYRGIAREFNFIHYVLFITYFPHLIAGPVLHHKQMMPQFGKNETYRINSRHVAGGLSIFILGLGKKVLIADYFATLATPIFDAVGSGADIRMAEAWLGALAYSLQLYFDFSGYCDMAIGLSLMLNIRLPLNFNSPYKATSIIDFWRRWHITLSNFLRDYLYIPLGGNRKGPGRRHVNLMLTMLIGGLWHGAGWTFVIWGGLHGLYLIINHGWENLCSRWRISLPGFATIVFGGGLTFLCVVVGWVFFRSPDLDTAKRMLLAMSGWSGIALPESLASLKKLTTDFPMPFGFTGLFPWSGHSDRTLLIIVGGLALVWLFPNVQQMFRAFSPIWEDEERARPQLEPLSRLEHKLGFEWKLTAARAVLAGILFFICLVAIHTNKASEFLYFQF